MGTLGNKLQQAFARILDPRREERIAELVSRIRKGLKEDRWSFSLETLLSQSGHQFAANDVEVAKVRVYRSLLSKSWEDEVITEQERESAELVLSRLGIEREDARRLELEFAANAFASALARALQDGVLTEGEETHLNRIAATVGMTLPEFARQFFKVESERFLRALFAAYVDDSALSEQEWNTLRRLASKLGIIESELLTAVSAQAQAFIEHVLADAKSDGALSRDEEQTIKWLLKTLVVPSGFQAYVGEEIRILRVLTNLEEGRLPSMRAPSGFETRAGEVIHFYSSAIWSQTRDLKSGPKTEHHSGKFILTDNRLVFVSPTKSHSVNYRRVVSHKGSSIEIQAQVENKPVQHYRLPHDDRLAYPVFRTAIAIANQTMLPKHDGAPSRYIPREVRQRVWQKYQGRCIECGASDYLEFDHIIPVGKGGNNSDNNVQLLCRRCNLKKSDNI